MLSKWIDLTTDELLTLVQGQQQTSTLEVLATERRLEGMLTMLIISFTWTNFDFYTTRKHIKTCRFLTHKFLCWLCWERAATLRSFGRVKKWNCLLILLLTHHGAAGLNTEWVGLRSWYLAVLFSCSKQTNKKQFIREQKHQLYACVCV